MTSITTATANKRVVEGPKKERWVETTEVGSEKTKREAWLDSELIAREQRTVAIISTRAILGRSPVVAISTIPTVAAETAMISANMIGTGMRVSLRLARAIDPGRPKGMSAGIVTIRTLDNDSDANRKYDGQRTGEEELYDLGTRTIPA